MNALFYEGQLVGKRRVDFLVEDKVMVETKALGVIDNSYLNKILNYLEAFNTGIGLLINFGVDKLVFRRMTNHKIKIQTNKSLVKSLVLLITSYHYYHLNH